MPTISPTRTPVAAEASARAFRIARKTSSSGRPNLPSHSILSCRKSAKVSTRLLGR